MIILTRLGGHEMAVNPDLIERAEPTPDTVITMVDGHKLVVAESVDEVVARVRIWRASIAAQAFALSQDELDQTDRPGPDPDQEPDRGALPGSAASVADDVAAHTVLGTTLARVLHLPSRED